MQYMLKVSYKENPPACPPAASPTNHHDFFKIQFLKIVSYKENPPACTPLQHHRPTIS